MEKNYISDPNYSIWINASAGTGKTKILIDRVLALLINQVNINKILCLTFTNIAAQEMKDRIYAQIIEWKICTEEDLYNSVKNILYREPTLKQLEIARNVFYQLTDPLNELKIKTIHSFCNDIIVKFPFDMNLSPNIEILDEVSLKIFIRQIKHNLFINEDEDISESVSDIFSKISEKKFEEIIEYIISIREKLLYSLENFGDIEKIIEEIKIYFNHPINFDYKKYLQDFSLRQQKYLDNLFIYWKIDLPNIKDFQKREILKNWHQADFYNKLESIDEFINCFLTKTGTILKNFLSSKIIASLGEEFKIFEQIISLIGELYKYKTDHYLLINTRNFLIIAKYIINSYEEYKYNINKIDYNDLIKKVSLLLTSENQTNSVLYKIDYQIEHILLDEAQDTNYQQWLIIDSLSADFFSGHSKNLSPRSIFIVGDIKQSIFSFQDANPKIFQKMKFYFKEKITNSSFFFKELTLSKSYRSTEAILNIVDKVFSQDNLFNEAFLGEKPLHIATRTNYQGIVDVLPLVKYKKSVSLDNDEWLMPINFLSKSNSQKNLAEFIAYMIAGWLKKKKILVSEHRLLEEKDIMILVRKRTEFIDYFLDYCQLLNIRNSGKDIIYLNEEIIIQDLLAMARFVLLPEDDLNLACLLKSPLFNFEEREIYELCHKRPSSLWENLALNVKKKSKYDQTYQYLLSYLNKADFYTPFEFFYEIIEVKNNKNQYIDIFGVIAENILKQFLDQVQKFEENNIISLQLFVQWVEEYDFSLKKEVHSIDGLRIMTIHGAKGLESPIVILADSTDIPDINENLLWINELLPIWPIKKQNFNSISVEIEEQIRKEQVNEYYRLLYVAMTRAKDELFICGKEKLNKLSDNSWYRLIEKVINRKSNITNIQHSGDIS